MLHHDFIGDLIREVFSRFIENDIFIKGDIVNKSCVNRVVDVNVLQISHDEMEGTDRNDGVLVIED